MADVLMEFSGVGAEILAPTCISESGARAVRPQRRFTAVLDIPHAVSEETTVLERDPG